eukprot:Skav218578  [mRNA]  locus=scaffold2610:471827:475942:+ [translate_table: standard]
MNKRSCAFQRAIESQDADEALRQINLVFEHGLHQSSVDVVGNTVGLPRRCFGRCRKKLTKIVRPCDPVVRAARAGEFTPEVGQPSLRIRQWTRQVRRLHSFAKQYQVALASHKPSSHGSCWQLWQSICRAPGFKTNFPSFAFEVMQVFIPADMPDPQYAKYVGDTLKIHLQQEVATWNQRVHEHRSEALKRDFQTGGSHAFSSVRDPQAPPFTAIMVDKEVRVIPQRWVKHGLSTLLIDGDPGIFDTQFPVYFQDQEAYVVGTSPGQIRLDRRVRYRNQQDMRLWQKHTIVDKQALHTQTADAWCEMWQRESPQDTAECWPEALETLTCLGDVPSMPYMPLTITEWKRHAATTKKASARGSCAYTPRELVLMPDELVEWLLLLLSHIEDCSMNWPTSIMTARVTMLAKTTQMPTHPLQLRPITITSRLYRTWAKYRSMQVFKHFQNILPPEVAGTASGISADMLAAVIANEVEDAIFNNAHRVGLTVDLIKCYNQVPRLPVIAALRRMGIPSQYLNAVWGMYQQLDRIIEIAGEVGSPVSSTTGIPEGCCFSIVAMLGLTAWATQYIHHQHETVECLAYADNWAFFTDCVDTLNAALSTLQNFVTMLKMKIAPDKSWVWGTHRSDRRALQQVTILGTPIPLKYGTTELGCDVSYCRRVNKKCFKQRLGKAKRVLKRVGKKRMPRKFKTKMSNQLASSIPGYGSELSYITTSEFKDLRAACCQANGRSRGGVNPRLAMNIPGDAHDPEFTLLVRKCKFWRRFLKAFPYRREEFFQKLASTGGTNHSGPAAVFRKTLADNHWTCLEHGVLQHVNGWRFNWYHSSKAYMVKMLRAAWGARVCSFVQSRKHFDLCNFDHSAFRVATRQLPAAFVTDAANYVVGKHVTNDALGHYAARAGDFQCPLCESKDGRAHRLLHCAGLRSIRDKYTHVVTWLREMPAAVLQFGILPWDCQWLDHSCCEWEPFPQLHRPADDDGVFHTVFTDGSASHTECFSTAVCSGAWLLADGVTVVDSGGSVLPGGDHSAYRGEVWAVIQALQRFHCLVLHTDCAAVVANCERLLSARAAGSLPYYDDHEDLWTQVWELLLTRPVHCLRVVKVKAHQDLQQLSDPYQRWLADMNNRVDALAKRLVKQYTVGCQRQLQKFCKSKHDNVVMLHSFFRMWGEMNAKAVEAAQKHRAPRMGTMPVFQLEITPAALVKLVCVIPACDMEHCLYGAAFLERVQHYFHQLEWDFGQKAVSLLELYCDFTLFTGTLAPVLLPGRTAGGPKVYRLRDQSTLADMAENTLQDQSRVWQRTIKWLLQHWSGCPWASLVKTDSLAKFGYTVDQNGLLGRPRFRSDTLVCSRLWSFFHTREGTRRSLGRRWAVSIQATAGGA